MADLSNGLEDDGPPLLVDESSAGEDLVERWKEKWSAGSGRPSPGSEDGEALSDDEALPAEIELQRWRQVRASCGAEALWAREAVATRLAQL